MSDAFQIFVFLSFVCAHALNPNVEFELFVERFGKFYSGGELEHRVQLFNKTIEKITKHNADPSRSFDMGITYFADMEQHEIDAQVSPARHGVDVPGQCSSNLGSATADVSLLPDAYDWSNFGFVASVKNQNPCGTCWAFASTAAVESAAAIATGYVADYSVSQQVECNKAGGCNECAFSWLAKGNKACTWLDYQYNCPAQSQCADGHGVFSRDGCGVLKVSGCSKLPANDEALLRFGVASQPVAIGIAFADDLPHYASGVFAGSCTGDRNHAVLIVGYGHDDASGLDYWRVKNSWSAGWGEQGYFRIRRGGGDAGGLCQVATDPSIPHVQASACSVISVQNNTRAEGGGCVGFNMWAGSLEQARSMCAQTDGCTEFTWDMQNNAVYVCRRSLLPNRKVDSPNWVVGTCSASSACRSGRFRSKPFLRAQGCAGNAVIAMSEADAQRSCLQTAGCVAYTYNRFLKNAFLCSDNKFSTTKEFGWTIGECDVLSSEVEVV